MTVSRFFLFAFILSLGLPATLARPANAVTFTITQESATFVDNGGGVIQFYASVLPTWQTITSVRLDYIGDLSAANENFVTTVSAGPFFLGSSVLSSGTTFDDAGMWYTYGSDGGSDFTKQHTAYGTTLLRSNMNSILKLNIPSLTFGFQLVTSPFMDTFSPNNVNVDPKAKLVQYGFSQFANSSVMPSLTARLTIRGSDDPNAALEPVPLPAAFPLLLSAFLGLLLIRRRRS